MGTEKRTDEEDGCAGDHECCGEREEGARSECKQCETAEETGRSIQATVTRGE